jgi:hypothetical protein
MHDNFRLLSIELDFTRDANALSLKRSLRLVKLWPVASEDYHGKNLVWVWLIEVQEGWLRPGAHRVPRGCHDTADANIFAGMVQGFLAAQAYRAAAARSTSLARPHLGKWQELADRGSMGLPAKASRQR